MQLIAYVRRRSPPGSACCNSPLARSTTAARLPFAPDSKNRSPETRRPRRAGPVPPANRGRIERRASVRAAVRRGLAMGRLVGRRLARRRVVVAAMCERRRRYDRREAATDQKCDELRAHPSLHWSRSTERNLAKSEPGASAQSWPILHPRLSARQAAATTAVLARPGAAGTD